VGFGLKVSVLILLRGMMVRLRIAEQHPIEMKICSRQRRQCCSMHEELID
jgi:hypothetical protein